MSILVYSFCYIFAIDQFLREHIKIYTYRNLVPYCQLNNKRPPFAYANYSLRHPG